MLNEKPTFLSKIRTVSCGDILWAFFLPTMRIDIGVINVYHPARLCLSLTQHVSPLCQPNTRQLSTMYSFWDFQQNIYIWCGILPILGGGVVEITLPFAISLKKNFCQKVLWNFYSKFSKILSCRKFCLEISSLWLCELDYFWFVGFFLDSLFSIFHVMQVSVISSLFWFDSSFRLTLISAYSPSRCCSN